MDEIYLCIKQEAQVSEIPSFLQTVTDKPFTVKKAFHFSTKGRNNLLDGVYRIHFDREKPKNILGICKRLSEKNSILYAEPVGIYELQSSCVPNDTEMARQWYLFKVKAPEAWCIQPGDTSLAIGIVDAGINFNHRDLMPNLQRNYKDPINNLDDDNNGFTDDYQGYDLAGEDGTKPDNDTRPIILTERMAHGTYVTGLAAASTDNQTDIAGSGRNCRFIPVKVTPEKGKNAGLVTHGAEGIIYAAQRGAKVINCSWGSFYFSRTLAEAVKLATQQYGALVVASAGNIVEKKAFYPCALDNVLCVTGLTSDDNAPNNVNYNVDIACPSGSISLAYPDTITTNLNANTSYATPIVAGAAALVAQHFKHNTPLQISYRLRNTADPLQNLDAFQKDLVGKGRLNIVRALTENPKAIMGKVRFENANPKKANFEAGDTVLMHGHFLNLLEKTVSLRIRIEPNPLIERVLNGSANAGQLVTLASFSTGNTPLSFILKNNIIGDTTIYIKLLYTDVQFSDFQYFKLEINTSYFNLSSGDVAQSIFNNGVLGYKDFPENETGNGLTYHGQPIGFELGFCLGSGPEKVTGSVRNEFLASRQDFRPIKRPELTQNPVDGLTKVTTFFSDKSAGQRSNNVNIKLESTRALPNCILHKLTVTHENVFVLRNFKIGLLADFYGGIPSDQEIIRWDSIRQFQYTQNLDKKINAGLLGLNPEKSVIKFSSVVLEGNSFVFSNANLWRALNDVHQGDTQIKADAVQMLVAHLPEIPPGDSATVYFAVLVADNTEALLAAADANITALRCNPPLFSMWDNPVISTERISCRKIRLKAPNFSNTRYLWDNQHTTNTRLVLSNGTYSVTLTHDNGCTKALKTTISEVIETSSPTVTDTLTDISDRKTIFFRVTPRSDTRYQWLFGDGYGQDTFFARHVYLTEGIFYPKLIVEIDSLCRDTFSLKITVTNKTGINPKLNHAILMYPNPTGNILVLEGLSTQNITVFNSLGQPIEVEAITAIDKVTINTSAWESGLYSIVVSDNFGKSWVKKILKR